MVLTEEAIIVGTNHCSVVRISRKTLKGESMWTFFFFFFWRVQGKPWLFYNFYFYCFFLIFKLIHFHSVHSHFPHVGYL